MKKKIKLNKLLKMKKRHFNSSNSLMNTMNDKKAKSLMNMVNNNINIENRLKEAKNKYERNLKSEIIYKKGQF